MTVQHDARKSEAAASTPRRTILGGHVDRDMARAIGSSFRDGERMCHPLGSCALVRDRAHPITVERGSDGEREGWLSIGWLIFDQPPADDAETARWTP